MSTELLIAEKPSAAEKIAFALADGKPVKKSIKKVSYYELTHDGKQLVVCSAVGHLYGLAQKGKSGWTYPVFEIEWQPSYKVTKGLSYVKEYVDALTQLAKRATSFTICTDFDTEGELIGLNALRFACKKKDAQRMKFSTLTKPDLREAYDEKFKTIVWGQAYAGETRHMLDWFYGINLSRALTASIKAAASFKVMSIGRVQGPSLKMIVDQEREIKAFVPVPFWQLQLLGKAKGKDIEAWHTADKFWKKEEAETIFSKIKKEKKALVKEVKRSTYAQPAPTPFDLTTLQTESYAHLGISPKEALALAQDLYLAGLISYPRTSSQQLSPKIGYNTIISQLKKQQEYSAFCAQLLKLEKLVPHNGEKTDPAHPALYPTGVEPKELNARQQKVYDLIVKRFLATFGPDATRETMIVTLDVKSEPFVAEGKRTVVPGWQVYYQPYIKFKDVELPDVKQGEQIEVVEISMLDKETQPPKRYTPSSIIKELERRNLGTKSTRAEIVDTLFKRGYAEGKQIKATELGMKTVETLEKHSPRILDEELTRHFEDDMELIREGKEKSQKVLDEAKEFLLVILNDFKTHEKEVGMALLAAVQETREEARTIGPCQACGKGTLKIVVSRKTRKQFIACDTYPDCSTTFALPQGALVKTAEKACEACTYPLVLVIRKGKRPQTLCINPACPTKKLDADVQKQVDKIEAGKIENKCPKCGNALVLRKSFYGQFFGCSTYPQCRHTESLEKKKVH